MELAPSTLNRLANSVLGAAPAAGAIACAVQADGALSRLAACLGAIGFAVIAVRDYRLGVSCRRATLVIRGYLRTRVIPRESITGITDFPAVRWTTHRGRKRWTPITAFVTSTDEISATRLHKERALGKLQRWARP
ncbi:hypothetical protein GCM10010503_31150 [Streptomyces lucensis JCM 4490]|uniref:PH domain-containing protein n=1 Tax=Streptomyces lucensis JCM 4490 TaxID=1306176 RepID=A0A918J846_9ACTN|nr:hypothetical protein [Streptomyces lucensis]GGW51973.1 hypothetical protein GCM10010503_31150 [Streptomyces lucensis JCM 4490]